MTVDLRTRPAGASGTSPAAAHDSAEEAKAAPAARGPRRLPRPRRPRRITVVRAAVFAAAIALWWAVTRFGGIDPVILPGPGDVAREMIDGNRCVPGETGRPECGVQGYFLWQHLLATLQRIAAGLVAGVAAGLAAGWALAMIPPVRRVVEPYITFLRALPPLGYIGLLIVWFGVGDSSKLVLLFLATFPFVTVATVDGVLGVPRDWSLAVRTLGASGLQVIRDVVIPGAAPQILVGIRLAAGAAWSSIVAAEMNDGIPGIGGLAYISGTQLDTALTVACIVIIGVTALAIDQALLLLERRAAPWRTAGGTR